MLHQDLGAVVACPDADAICVQDFRYVMGMNAIERKREDAVVLFCLIASHKMQMRNR